MIAVYVIRRECKTGTGAEFPSQVEDLCVVIWFRWSNLATVMFRSCLNVQYMSRRHCVFECCDRAGMDEVMERLCLSLDSIDCIRNVNAICEMAMNYDTEVERTQSCMRLLQRLPLGL